MSWTGNGAAFFFFLLVEGPALGGGEGERLVSTDSEGVALIGGALTKDTESLSTVKSWSAIVSVDGGGGGGDWLRDDDSADLTWLSTASTSASSTCCNGIITSAPWLSPLDDMVRVDCSTATTGATETIL